MPDVRMPDGQVVRFPDTFTGEQIRGIIASKYPREVGEAGSAKPMAERDTAGHYSFDGSNIPGYDPVSGEMKRGVDALPADDTLSELRTMSGGMLEGIPVVGPLLRGGVERAAAGTIAGFSPDVDYAQALKAIQEGTAAEKQANPTLDKASQVAGAVAGTIPMVMAAPGAFGAGSGGLLARSAASGASGAGLGGLDAAVRSGGDPEAIGSGMLWGGTLGVVAPGIGELVGSGVRSVARRVGLGGSKAEQAFGRAMGADGIDDAATKLSQMGDDARPMDLGPNLQRQAAALAATPGKAQEVVRSSIASRQAGAGGRIANALDDALGQNVDTIALADDIIARRAAQSKPLYDAAYSKPVPYTKELETLLKRPTVGQALKKAQRLAADEGIASKQFFANVADDGAVTITNVPDVRQLDLTKRALDDVISTAQRAGNNNEARIATQLKNQLVGMIDDAVPEYKAARAAFSGPSAVVDALEEGQKVFKSAITPNQLRTQMMKMGEAEREAFVQGARAQVADIMGTARSDAAAARNTFMKGYNKEKLALLVGDEQAAKLLRSLEAETAFTRTRDVVTGNSETAARLAAQDDVGAGSQKPGVFKNALNMNFGDAAAGAVDKITARMRGAAQQGTNEELARLLTTNDPAAVTRSIKMVQQAAQRGDISAQRAKEIVQGLMLGTAQNRNQVPAR